MDESKAVAILEEDTEMRFEFIRPDGKPMIVIWDKLEECLFVDPAPIPMPLYRPVFNSEYPKSIGHRVQFSIYEQGEPWDNNYIYSTERTTGMKGNKLRTFRHNVNKFSDSHDMEFTTLRDFRQITSFVTSYNRTGGYNINDFMRECSKLIDINIKEDIPWTDELLAKFLLYSVIKETERLQPSDEYIFSSVHRNTHYQIGIIDDRPVSLDIGLRLGPNVLGHYVGKYDKKYKYLVDRARYAFYKSALEHGYLYINDGSDLDDPGLRQLKRKFHPVKVLKIYEYDPDGGDTPTESPDTPPSTALHSDSIDKDTPAPSGDVKST